MNALIGQVVFQISGAPIYKGFSRMVTTISSELPKTGASVFPPPPAARPQSVLMAPI